MYLWRSAQRLGISRQEGSAAVSLSPFVRTCHTGSGYGSSRASQNCKITLPGTNIAGFTETTEVIRRFWQNIAPACKQVHICYKLPPPMDGYESMYNYDAWVDSGKLAFKATQKTHGSTAETAIWFLMRWQKRDYGLKCEQIQREFIFEALAHPSQRMHVFLEDLRIKRWCLVRGLPGLNAGASDSAMIGNTQTTSACRIAS